VYGDGGLYMSIKKIMNKLNSIWEKQKRQVQVCIMVATLFISLFPNPIKFKCLIMKNNVPAPIPTKTLRNSDHLWTNSIRFFTEKLVHS